jgi:hypothetical protein
MTRSRFFSLAVLSFVLAAAGPTSRVADADDKPILQLTAFAVDMGGPQRARSGTLDITIERWSTPDEVAKLQAALTEKGEDGLLDALQKMKRVGNIRTPASIGWPMHLATEVVGSDGTRRIMFATDRPMSFWEVVNRPRSADYAFLVGEIRLRANGKGEGKLVTAGRVDYNPETKTLEIENYSTQPVRLSEVRVVK